MLQLHTFSNSLSRWRVRTGLALACASAVALAVLGAGPLLAGGEPGGSGGASGGSGNDPLAASSEGSGGGSVGSLPLTAPPQPPSSGTSAPGAPSAAPWTDPARPAFSLVGREREIRALIVAAYGDGYVERIPLGGDRVRMNFHGSVTIELARGRFHTSFVSAEIVVGASFEGGRAVLLVEGEPRASRSLARGAFEIGLQRLSQAGLTDLGVLWRATSRSRVRAAIEIDSSASVIRIRQR